jgi:hypothetical protein
VKGSKTPGSAKAPTSPVLLDYRGDLLTVSSKSPLPPGSRVDFELPLDSAGSSVRVTGKIASASVDSKGGFRLVIRVHSLPRSDRAAILDAL